MALSAVSAGVSSGMAQAIRGAAEGSLLNGMGSAARAIVSNVATQGIGIVTNLQHGFNWRAVAAASDALCEYLFHTQVDPEFIFKQVPVRLK